MYYLKHLYISNMLTDFNRICQNKIYYLELIYNEIWKNEENKIVQIILYICSMPTQWQIC